MKIRFWLLHMFLFCVLSLFLASCGGSNGKDDNSIPENNSSQPEANLTHSEGFTELELETDEKIDLMRDSGYDQAYDIAYTIADEGGEIEEVNASYVCNGIANEELTACNEGVEEGVTEGFFEGCLDSCSSGCETDSCEEKCEENCDSAAFVSL